MKKLITLISFVIIISFVAVAVISLIPEKSREGLPTPETSEVPTETPQSTLPQTTESPVTPPATAGTSPFPTDTPVIPPVVTPPVVTPTPTEEEYPSLSISSTANNEDILVDGVKIGTVSFPFPLVAYPDNTDVAEKINSALKTKVLNHIDNFRQECEFLAMDFDPEEMSPYRYYASSKLCIGKKTASVKITCEIDYGSIQTEKRIFCYNFSLESGKEIELYELRIDNGVVIDAIIKKSLTMTGMEFSPNYQTFIKEHICNSWYIDKNMINFVYVPFEIAAGNYGIVEIAVDLNTLGYN